VIAVVILQKNLPKDTWIREPDVALARETVAKLNAMHAPLSKCFIYPQQAIGRILKAPKAAGSWLTDDDFYPVGTGPYFKLKPGFRDVILRVDDPAIVSGMLHAGSYVDVIFTGENPDDQSKVTERLCSGLEVIRPPVTQEGVSNIVTTIKDKNYIHVAATPAQATQLELAQRMEGTISVTLTSPPPDSTAAPVPLENEMAASTGNQITERQLLHLPPPPAPPQPPERTVIQEYRGNKVSYVVFNGDDEPVAEEEVRQKSLPASAKAAAAPAGKKCKTCGKKKGSGATPAPTPVPTPAAPAST
jgi:Flp pilus assembly protein CpaB